MEEILPDTDVLYMTRIQKERFTSEEEYNKVEILKMIVLINTIHRFYSSGLWSLQNNTTINA